MTAHLKNNTESILGKTNVLVRKELYLDFVFVTVDTGLVSNQHGKNTAMLTKLSAVAFPSVLLPSVFCLAY